MTVYVCQVPHQRPAIFWSAESEDDVIRLCETDNSEFDDIDEAIQEDQRGAYHATDLFDLYIWVWNSEAVFNTGLQSGFLRYFSSEIEEFATRIPDPDNGYYDAYIAFDGRFQWREVTGEWTLDGCDPQETHELAHALCAAAKVIALEKMKSTDV